MADTTGSYLRSSAYSSGTGTYTKTYRRIWGHWNTAASATAATVVLPYSTSTAASIWNRWVVKETHNHHLAALEYAQQFQQRPPTVRPRVHESTEASAARRARENEERNRQETLRKFRVEQVSLAQDKAEKLLLSVLTEEQQRELREKRYVTCKSRKSGNRYRVYRGTHGNVRQIDHTGKEIAQLCVQPDNVPEGDSMIAQLLHIEHNEEEFRKTANITRLVN